MDYRERIQNSLDYIETHLTKRISARELSHLAGYSLFHYCRLFQMQTGLAVNQYILRHRLVHAIYEISCGSTRLDVIVDYGFDTYAGFYKAFVREFDQTPSNFLKAGYVKRPYRLNIDQEDYMVSHKKAAEILSFWNLENVTVCSIYHESTGEKSNKAFYVDTDCVLKCSEDPDELENLRALKNVKIDKVRFPALI